MTEARAARPLSPPWDSAAQPPFGLRFRWFVVSLPAFTLGWAAAQAMGEVVGEAWGGASLHLLGHTLGTVLLVGLLAAAGWLALRQPS